MEEQKPNGKVRYGMVIRCPKCKTVVRVMIDRWGKGKFVPYKKEEEWWEEKMHYGYDLGEMGDMCLICKNSTDLDTEWIEELDRCFTDYNPLAESLGPVLEKLRDEGVIDRNTDWKAFEEKRKNQKHGRDSNVLENFFYVWYNFNISLYEYGPRWFMHLSRFLKNRIGEVARFLKLFWLFGRDDYMAWDIEDKIISMYPNSGYDRTEKQWQEYYRLWDVRKGKEKNRYKDKIK